MISNDHKQNYYYKAGFKFCGFGWLVLCLVFCFNPQNKIPTYATKKTVEGKLSCSSSWLCSLTTSASPDPAFKLTSQQEQKTVIGHKQEDTLIYFLYIFRLC